MAESILKIISTNPSFMPGELEEGSCRIFLEEIFDAKQIKFVCSSEIEFIDPGANFESVSCNICQHEISIAYWNEKMDEAAQTHFTNLNLRLPCCNSISSLNSLEYRWPAGFARFVMMIKNGNTELNDNDLQKIQAILNTPLRIIWARY